MRKGVQNAITLRPCSVFCSQCKVHILTLFKWLPTEVPNLQPIHYHYIMYSWTVYIVLNSHVLIVHNDVYSYLIDGHS